MESLAYIHAVVNYEDPNPLELRSIEEIISAVPSSVVMGVAGAAIAVSVFSHAPNADAALRRGSVCSAVSTLQSALQSKGYTVGGVDGAFGNHTEFAVKQFQVKNGLSTDGVVGSATAGTMGLNAGISCGSGGGNPGGGSGGTGSLVRVTAASGLNIRSSPSTSSSIVGSLGSGAVVSIVYAGGSNGFAHLTSGGWISSQYITPTSGGGSGGGGGDPGGGSSGQSSRVIAGNGVKFRSGPGLGYGQIGGASYGERVYVTGERASSNGYLWAKLSGQSGWVATAGLDRD